MSPNQKNIYTINPEQDYLGTLARYVYDLANGDFLALSRIKVILPNKRSENKLKEWLVEISPHKAVILPEIFSLGAINEEDVELSRSLKSVQTSVRPAIPKEQKLLLLAELVREKGTKDFEIGEITFEQSLKLAKTLAELIDDFGKYEIDPDCLSDSRILSEELSSHRQISLNFIKFVMKEYPKMLEAYELSDPAKNVVELIDEYRELLEREHQENYVIIAGSTGSVPATRRLIRTILGLNKGRVFLPYIDLRLKHTEWEEIRTEENEINHQKHLIRLLDFLEVRREDIKVIGGDGSEKTELVSEMLKPATLIETWKKYHNKQTGLSWIKLIQAENNNNEAKIVSAIMRHRLEEKKSICLVTNDRDLAEKVRIYLKRFDINTDDSAGRTLDKTKEGNLLLLVANVVSGSFRTSDLMALFKHPYVKFKNIETFEKILRKNNVKKLDEIFSKMDRAIIGKDIYEALWNIREMTKDITGKKYDFSTLVHITVDIANMLSVNKITKNNEVQTKIEEVLNNFLQFSYRQTTEIALFADSLEVILSDKKMWPRNKITENIAILGPIEARLQSFDCVILGGMQLGSWPARKFSPWLGKNICKDIDMPFEEDMFALSTHDFAALLHSKEVYLSHSSYNNGEPANESPLISRIKTFYKAFGKDLNQEHEYAEWVKKLDGVGTAKKDTSLPYPKPPAEARFNRLSVTKVETLLKNPYAIYASEILRLRKLDELEQEPEAKDYGNFCHKVLEDFCVSYIQDETKLTLSNFVAISERVYAEQALKNLANPAWLAQIQKLAPWFIAEERKLLRDISNIVAEKKAEMVIDGFTLVCKADRIEIEKNGRINIIDYKTGATSIPEENKVLQLRAPQVLLAALMVKKGAFEEVDPANKELGDAVYYNISYSDDGPYRLPLKKVDLEDITVEVESELAKLIKDMNDPATPFLIRPNPESEPAFDDYEHLERIERKKR